MNVDYRQFRRAAALITLSPLIAFGQACGPADGTIRLTVPTAQLCASGTPGELRGTGPFFWDCFVGTSVVPCGTRPHCHDVDGNGQIHATSDGLIITRVMLGMTGTSVSSAAQPGSPRSTWSEIRNFLRTSCGYANLTCTANGQNIVIAPQPSNSACVDAITPVAATMCCSGTLTAIVYDDPIGSNSCLAVCGAPIGAARETKPE